MARTFATMANIASCKFFNRLTGVHQSTLYAWQATHSAGLELESKTSTRPPPVRWKKPISNFWLMHHQHAAERILHYYLIRHQNMTTTLLMTTPPIILPHCHIIPHSCHHVINTTTSVNSHTSKTWCILDQLLLWSKVPRKAPLLGWGSMRTQSCEVNFYWFPEDPLVPL